jgi:hypothetical protein
VTRVEYTNLNGDEVSRSQSFNNMSVQAFDGFARERMLAEAKRIYEPYDRNRPKIVEAMRLMDGDQELCRVGLDDVMLAQRYSAP